MNIRTVIIDGQAHALSFSEESTRIEPRTGVAFTLNEGEELTVTDPLGQQVADVTAFMAHDTHEWLSAGRTIEHANRLYTRLGDTLYSNLSNPMFTIIEDTVGRHDFILAPCSPEMFAKHHGDDMLRPSCLTNLCENLKTFDISPNAIPATLSLFMNIKFDPDSGELLVGKPHSSAGDRVRLLAKYDMVVGLTACSAETYNNGTCKPIEFSIKLSRINGSEPR